MSTVVAARRHALFRSVAGPLLDLLWASMSHRFGTDVELGGSTVFADRCGISLGEASSDGSSLDETSWDEQ